MNPAPDGNAGPGRPSRRWSLSLRLTSWYVLWSFVILLAASVAMYVMLVHNLTREHDQFLVDKIRILRQQLRDHPDNIPDLQEEVEETWAPRQYMQVYARVIDADGRIVVESPHMAERLPEAVFPPRSSIDGDPPPGIDLPSPTHFDFRGLAAA